MTTDLHLHSTASDGTLSPAALVAHAAACGVTTLALTDHDTVAGLPAARAAADEHGLRLVNGVELSVRWQKRTLHIVGLGFAPDEPTLVDTLDRLQTARHTRAEAMARRLASQGVRDALARAEALAGDGQITRAHFARLLTTDGLARDNAQAFKRFLAPGKPGHVAADWVSLEVAIDAIRAAGGLSVLAHPFGYRFTHSWRGRALDAFRRAGGHAVEVVTGVSQATQNRRAALEAAQRGLRASAGSDFHSPSQFWLAPGRLAPLPDGVQPVPWLKSGT